MVRFGRFVALLFVVSGSAVVCAQSIAPAGAPSQDQPCQPDAKAASADAPAQPTSLEALPACPPPAATTNQGPPSNSKRILGIIPNFTTADDTLKNRVPLASRQKFVLASHQMFDISAHLGNLLQASIQQASSGQPHYTGASFEKRLAAAEADQSTSCLFIYGVLPAMFHTDPRYFRREEGPAASRAWYAISRTFVTRNDAGANVFNASQLGGQLSQAGLSTLYYPQQDRTLGGTMTNWAIQLVYNSAFNVLKEFYPDVLAKVHHRRTAP